MRLADYTAALRAFFGIEDPTTAVATQFTRFVNQANEEVSRAAGVAFWARRSHSFLTVPRISQTGSSGVASVAGGSRAVTLAAASRVDRRYIGGAIRIAGAQETYLIVDVRTSTAITIDPPFSGAAFGTTITDQDCEILQWNFRLPPDLLEIDAVKQSATPLTLITLDKKMLDQWAPDPMVLGERGNPEVYLVLGAHNLPDLWSSAAQRTITAGGVGGQLSAVLNDIRISDGTATADLLNDALLTTAGGSAQHSILRGFHFRLAGTSRYYKIREVVAGTPVRLHIGEPYREATATDQEYVIGPSAPGWLRLYPIPDTMVHVDIEYFAAPAPLTADEEEPSLPRELHSVILDGALMFLARYTQNLAAAQLHERAFDAGLVRAQMLHRGSGDQQYRFRPRARIDRQGPSNYPGRFPFSVTYP